MFVCQSDKTSMLEAAASDNTYNALITTGVIIKQVVRDAEKSVESINNMTVGTVRKFQDLDESTIC